MEKEQNQKRPVEYTLEMPVMMPGTPTNVARVVLKSRPNKEGE